MRCPLRRGGTPLRLGGPALGLAGRTERMTCPKCGTVLIEWEDQTTDGAWSGWRCPICGYVQDTLMVRHRITRLEPFRQLPYQPMKRPGYGSGGGHVSKRKR